MILKNRHPKVFKSSFGLLASQRHFAIEVYKNRICVIAMVTLFFANGCKKAVEVDPPITGLVSSTVYASNATAAAAVTSIYSGLSGGDFPNGTDGISCRAGLAADEFKNYSNDPILSQFYINALNSGNAYFWNELYQYIYVANKAIEGLTASTAVTPSLKQQLTGEAKFMRAFLHFYLTSLYGDVPWVTTTDYRINNVINRTPQQQVYQQIITDLKDAQELLSSDFLAPDGTTTTERVRPNKGAATALLARVYLYIGDWDNAEMQATAVINDQVNYTLLDELDKVFLANSGEAIWQLQPVNPGFNTQDGAYFVLQTLPGNDFPVALNTHLLNNFELSDYRMDHWVGKYTDTISNQTYYYPYKYKVGQNQPLTEYLMVLRLAEQYLIRAEARAQKGDSQGAQDDLNRIRHRAGLLNTTATSQADLLTAVAHERQVELFTEWGHRWLDLKRTSMIDAVMSVITPEKGGTWSDNWKLYPIPRSEILINPNLTQNQGY